MLYYVSEEGRTVTITEGQCRVQPEALAGSPLEHGHIIQLDVSEHVRLHPNEQPLRDILDHYATEDEGRSISNTYDHSLLRADSVDGMLQAFYDVLEGELL